jgi:DNA (cytosine-5)-methyltransferase 1
MERQTGMSLWLHIDTRGSFNTSRQQIDLDRRPAPTVTTGAFSCGSRQHHYWIEVDGMNTYRPDPGKPPYRVPSMAEIAGLACNAYTVVSTFSGCGGSCLGFKMAGFKVVWASEFVPAAQATYRANHPGVILDTRDIRQVQPKDILQATGLRAGQIDVLEGSPPCASFSTAGKRERVWGKVKAYSDTKQRTDDLFFEFARLLQGLQPKVFVAENVSGLIKGTAKGYFLEILRALKACGYRVQAKLLDAQWFGVPQMRQRVIFIGVRHNLGREPAFPKPLPYRYSVRDALPWVVSVPCLLPGKVRGRKRSEQPCPSVCTDSIGGNNRNCAGEVEVEADISRYAIGQEWDHLKPGEKSEKYLNLIKPEVDRPCPTICQSHGNPSTAGVVHPTEKRKFTIGELKRICGFPDDFILTGTFARQWERLGRAVPPVMMFYIARTIRDEVLAKCAA